MDIRIYPYDENKYGALSGSGPVQAPPSKSMAHRYLIAAALAADDATAQDTPGAVVSASLVSTEAEGAGGAAVSASSTMSTIRGMGASEDVMATTDCLRALGAEIVSGFDEKSDTGCGDDVGVARIKGFDPRNAYAGAGIGSGSGADPSDDIADNAGAARIKGFDTRNAYAGAGRSSKEESPGSPGVILQCRESGSTLRFLIPLCALSGSPITLTGRGRLMERPLTVYEEIFSESGVMMKREPGSVTVQGRLRGGHFEMDGDVSSQFVSGMLFALPLLDEDSEIKLRPPVESRPYIDMTIRALETFGVTVTWEDETTLKVPGGQRYSPRDVTVEGDWSGAAFLYALGLDVSGLDDESPQGDRICREYFRRLDEGRAELDISDCPDLGPVLMAYAAMHKGCVLTGTRRLSIKESDRGRAMQEELSKFGVETVIHEDSIETGCGLSAPGEALCGHNDHRIVMALAVLCSKIGGVIEGAEAVSKSFPGFFETLAKAGIRCEGVSG